MKIMKVMSILQHCLVILVSIFMFACSQSSVEDLSANLDTPPPPPVEDPILPPPPPPPEQPIDNVIDEIAEFEELSTWTSSASLAGLNDGDAVGNTNPWTNFANGGYTITAAGGEATYYQDALGLGFPSVFVCGRNYVDSTCVGSGNSRGTQLRLAGSHSNYSLLLGSDAVTGSNTGGGSFTLLTLVARVNGNETPIIYHRDGNAAPGLGVYLGWRDDTTFRFSTQGRTGANAVQAVVPAHSGPALTLIAARFSRTEGLKLYIDGTLVAEDPLATNGVDITNSVAPTLGYRQGNAAYGVHVFEWIEVNSAMSTEQLCIAHDELAASYSLTINDLCP